MKFPGYQLAPDESGFSARFIVGRAGCLLETHIERSLFRNNASIGP